LPPPPKENPPTLAQAYVSIEFGFFSGSGAVPCWVGSC